MARTQTESQSQAVAAAEAASRPEPARDRRAGEAEPPDGRMQQVRTPKVRAFEALFTIFVLGILTWAAAADPGQFANAALLGWALAVAAMDLMPVEGPATASLSLSFPILLAVAMIYSPAVAGAVAFVGSVDQRELRREMPVLKALFVRAEVALSVMAAGVVFHAIAPHKMMSPWYLIVPAVLAAVATDYVTNRVIVAYYLSLATRTPFRTALSGLQLGKRYEFVLSYIGLGLFASVIALLFVRLHHNGLAVLLFIGPLLLARQMFFRTRELQRRGEELQERHAELEETLEELHRLEVERRRLLERTVEATEEERRRIAAEIHDGPIQHLAAIVFRLEALRGALERGEHSDDMAGTVARTQDDLRGEVVELRRMITELRPPVLDQLGLEEALQDHLEEVGHDAGIEVSMAFELSERLEPELETVLYRVSQEALTNVVKHADARHVRLSLGEADGDVMLQIVDDGVGFNPEEAPTLVADGHLGLIAMRERVESVGGSWDLQSTPGEGTTVRSTFPREPADHSG